MGRSHGRAEPEPPPFPIGWVQGSAPRWVVWGKHTTQQLSKSLASPLLSGSARGREKFVKAAWEGWCSSQSVGKRDRAQILQMLDWFEGVVDKLCYVGALSFTKEIMAQIPGKVVKRRGCNAVVATKMSHLQDFFNDFPKMACSSTSYEAYERLHKLAPCSLRKWKERCVIEHWPSWTESARRRYSCAPQYLRDLLCLPRLGRNFDKYYPPAVVQKTQAYVRKRRVSAMMGLTNRATKSSSNELPYDSQDMVDFRALVLAEAASKTVPELVGNMDEMWSRQMRETTTRDLYTPARKSQWIRRSPTPRSPSSQTRHNLPTSE